MDIQKKFNAETKTNNTPNPATETMPTIQSMEKLVAGPAKTKISRFILPIILLVFFLASTGAAYYFYRQTTNLKNKLPVITDKDQQAKDIVSRVSRLIVLPTNEEPTIATVSEPEKLKDQPFFAQAKTGDKVLIYSQAKKAILYDPTADRIVEVAPLNLNQTPTP